MRKTRQCPNFLDGPLLSAIRTNYSSSIEKEQYPFSLPIIKNLKELSFNTQVTFFVGENGTGKSTVLEAIAHHAGFGVEGGSKNIHFNSSQYNSHSAVQMLADQLIFSWRQKPKDGYFFRAESFHNVANYLDYLERECGGRAYIPYGGKSLHEQSHGESFLSFFTHRVGQGGFFVLDEPESALSPQRQLALLVIINKLCKHVNTQFIIATHSSLLLAFPSATIYSFDKTTIEKIRYKDTDHYQVTRGFLNSPELYLKNLLDPEE